LFLFFLLLLFNFLYFVFVGCQWHSVLNAGHVLHAFNFNMTNRKLIIHNIGDNRFPQPQDKRGFKYLRLQLHLQLQLLHSTGLHLDGERDGAKRKKLSQLSERAIHNIIFHFLQDIIKLGALRCGSLCCQHLLKSRADFIAIFTVQRTLDTGISQYRNSNPNPKTQTKPHPRPRQDPSSNPSHPNAAKWRSIALT